MTQVPVFLRDNAILKTRDWISTSSWWLNYREFQNLINSSKEDELFKWSHYILPWETQRNWGANSFVQSYKHCRDKKKNVCLKHFPFSNQKMYGRICFKGVLGHILIRDDIFAYFNEIINTCSMHKVCTFVI